MRLKLDENLPHDLTPHCEDHPAAARSTTDSATGTTHGQALRALGNKLIGQLHGCLRHNTFYDEAYA